MVTSKVRKFRGFARFQADETVWAAQVVTWLPLVSQAMSIGFLLFTLLTGGFALMRHPWVVLLAAVVPLLFLSLYGLAGAWIGAHESRGFWLAIALFTFSLVTDVLRGHFVSFDLVYSIVALIIVIRAGRSIGVRHLAPAA
jgi:hypothetical protein